MFSEDWTLVRRPLHQYNTKLKPEQAKEEAFHLTNMPEELIPEEDLPKLKGFRGPSLSVGDIVQTEAEGKCTHFLCTGMGWESKEVEIPLPGPNRENPPSPEKEEEEEKGKLYKRIQGLLNDYSGEYFTNLKQINFRLPNKRVKQFLQELLEADSKEAEQKALHKLGKDISAPKKKKEPEPEI